MRKIKIGITFAVIAVIAIGIYTTMASAVNVSWDFEDGKVPQWKDFYGNYQGQIETEGNGNKYLKMHYTGLNSSGRKYFDVKAADVNGSGTIQINYDIMYPEISSEKDGMLQYKKRTGPGSAQTAIIARLGIMDYFMRAPGISIKALDNTVLMAEEGRWYSVRLIIHNDSGSQSIYILDRNTKTVLGYMEQYDLENKTEKANMISFSSGIDMCIDNLKIYSSSYGSGYISGAPYVTSATKNKYYLFGKDSSGDYSDLPKGEVSWVLETPRSGVSVDSATGRIIVGSKPEPGPVILRAEKETDTGTIVARTVVNVSQ